MAVTKGRHWTAHSLQQHAAATIDDATDMIQLLCHDTRTQQLPKQLLDYVTDVPNLIEALQTIGACRVVVYTRALSHCL